MAITDEVSLAEGAVARCWMQLNNGTQIYIVNGDIDEATCFRLQDVCAQKRTGRINYTTPVIVKPPYEQCNATQSDAVRIVPGRYEWRNVGGGDCGGRGNSCSAGGNPDDAECNQRRVNQVAICWNGGWANKPNYPPRMNCGGDPAHWCTYKNVTPEQCSGGATAAICTNVSA
jgi:hypothetical protein